MVNDFSIMIFNLIFWTGIACMESIQVKLVG